MHRSEFKIGFYRLSYKVRNLFLYFTLLFVIIEAIDLLWHYGIVIDNIIPQDLLDKATPYILVLWVLSALIWLAFPAWFNLYFRYIAWWISCRCGVMLKWISSGWRRALILLAGIASVLFMHIIIMDAIQNGHKDLLVSDLLAEMAANYRELLIPEFWMKVIAISALISLISWAYQSRKKIVLLKFANQSGDDKLNATVEGISSVLMNEFTRLINLCKTVDDTDPYTPSSQGTSNGDTISISPNISVSGIGENLKSVVTSDSKVKFAFLEIPIGAIMGILGTTFEGPKLSGSLLKEDGCLVLIANMSGGSINGNWRISSSDLSGEDVLKTDHVGRLAQQLAVRIFTDLEKEHLGTPRWKAVCHYTEGLRAYRETLRTDRSNGPQLRRAEREFILALGEDKKFLYCFYNLGIVYQTLEQYESAFSVLKRSAAPDLPTAFLSKVYYAMAKNHSRIRSIRAKYPDFRQTVQLCEKAISLSPDDARAWDLMGMIKRGLKEQELGGRLQAGKEKGFWNKEIIPLREIAAALAWRKICRCAFCGLEDKAAKSIAITCTRNLAVAHSQADPSSGRPFFRQSIYLSPNDADIFFELAKTLNELGKWKEAASVWEEALKMEQKPEYWSGLALAYSGQYKPNSGWRKFSAKFLPSIFRPYIYFIKNNPKNYALYACRHALDYASEIKKDALVELNEALFKISDQEKRMKNETDRDYQIRLDVLNGDIYAALYDFLNEILKEKFSELKQFYDIEKKVNKEESLNEDEKLTRETVRIKYSPPVLDLLMHIIGQLEKKRDTNKEDELGELFAQISPRLERLYENENESDMASNINKKMVEVQRRFPILVQSIDFFGKLYRNKDHNGKNESVEAYKERLKQLSDEYSGLNFAGALISLQLLSLNNGNIEDLNEAICNLERNNPMEIINQRLHGKLSYALLNQKGLKLSQSLYHAERSVTLDPVDSTNRIYISEVYRSYGSFEEAAEQLEIGFSLDPKDPDFLLRSASLQSEFDPGTKKQEDSKKAFSKYIKSITSSLELSQCKLLKDEEKAENEMLNRSRIHYSLGLAYSDLNEYEKAIHNFIMAKNLMPESKLSHFIAEFGLGETYLYNKSYVECEDLFRTLIKKLEELIKSKNLAIWDEIPREDSIRLKEHLAQLLGIDWAKDANIEEIEKNRTIQIYSEKNCLFLILNQDKSGAILIVDDGRIAYFVAAEYNGKLNIYHKPIEEIASVELAGKEYGYEDISIGYMIGITCLELAFSYSERDANLSDALNLVEKADSYIKCLQDGKGKRQLEAGYADRRAWVLYKQAKLGDGVCDISEAIDSLKQAVGMDANCEYYLHLAMALEHKLQTEEEALQVTDAGKKEIKRNLVLALACCDHAMNLDAKSKFKEEATNLKKRLEDLKTNSLKETDFKDEKKCADQLTGYA